MKSMSVDTAQRVLRRLDWAINKQERFLNLVSRIQRFDPKDREDIIKDACWVDGTVEGQLQYCIRKRERLTKVYQKIYKRYIDNRRL